MNDIEKNISIFPSIISKEQLCKILHISKRKATWMLENDFIPCKINDSKTHKYIIRLDDVLYYISDSKNHPYKYVFPNGIFSSKHPHKNVKVTKIDLYKASIIEESNDEFIQWLTEQWINIPDKLSVNYITKLTGYSNNKVKSWIKHNQLQAVYVQNDILTSKVWMIEFYASYGLRIEKMSKAHLTLIEKYIKTIN